VFISPRNKLFLFNRYLDDTVDSFVANVYQKEFSMKMYVGNLIYNMTEEELRNLFIPFGEVLYSRIITDQYTRQSKNMGYVKMAVKEEGRKAARELNGKLINNRVLIVKKA